MASIKTLVKDIQALFIEGKNCDQANVDALGTEIALAVSSRLKDRLEGDPTPSLRLSQIGKPDRQVWYDFHHKETPEPLSAATRLKFMYGDIVEALVLFLAKEAGHEVHERQRVVSVGGVDGHIDGTVDGCLVDVKSASSYGFKKFEEGTLREDDPFGYIPQLAAYDTGLGNSDGGAFLAVDKTNGKLCLLEVSKEELNAKDSTGRIASLKQIVGRETPPERCYEPKPDGKSGNYILPIGCSYCNHKFECHRDANEGRGLRTFLYSTGPKFFTTVQREPDVYEVLDNKKEAITNE